MQVSRRQLRLLYASTQAFVAFVFLLFHLANLTAANQSVAATLFGTGFILCFQGFAHWGVAAVVYYNTRVRD